MKPDQVVGLARGLWRAYGVYGSIHRILFELRKKTSLYRSRPRAVGDQVGASRVPANWPFVPNAERVRSTTNQAEGLARARRVLGGEHHAYRWTWVKLPGTPQEWHTHPVSNFSYPVSQPWFRAPHYDRDAGDVKDMWEPARFGWSYDLMRGFMMTGDDSYARAFWRGFEMFMEGNPPFCGVQWSCGQETTIRAIAWLWAEGTFQSAPSSTPDRLAHLRRALVWSAERVEDAIAYAVWQRNNHGISETAGLAILGARFVGDEPRAARWLRRGHQLIEKQVLDQFIDDGWYIQHSFNYTRLALDQVVGAERALRARELSFSTTARARIAAGVRFLGQVMDAPTGFVPNHGNNDGAYVLPLSTSSFRDYRPSLTAAAVTFGGEMPEGAAADAEVLAWLDAPAPAVAAPLPLPFAASGKSGWALGRTASVMLFARAGRYTSRPTHMDALHVDLWVGGTPVAVDAGTYRYWAPAPWGNGLVDAERHNTVTLDGFPMAQRGPRYLWIRWPSARVVSARVERHEDIRIELVNESWLEHGIEHRRTCEVAGDTVTITDDLRAPSSFRARASVHWLLDGDPAIVSVCGSRPTTHEVIAGDPRSVDGWIAEGYGVRRPITAVRASAMLEEGHLRFVSVFDVARRTSSPAADERETTAVGGGQR